VKVCDGFNWLNTGPMVDSCANGNEASGPIKGQEFLDHFSDHQLLKDLHHGVYLYMLHRISQNFASKTDKRKCRP
jgi:hypothetical protein